MKKELFMGYEMTKNQIKKLKLYLKEDIIERYNHPEYWDQDLVDEFVRQEV